MATIRYSKASVELTTPYNMIFVEGMRDIPSRSKSWDPDRRVWTIWVPYVTAAVELTLTLFPKSTVIGEAPDESFSWDDFRNRTEDDYQKQQEYARGSSGGPTTNAGSSPDRSVLFVTDDAPEAVCKAAYKALARLLHPDNGGTTRQMQDLNGAWDRIQTREGWS